MNPPRSAHVAIVGATASGKSAVAHRLAVEDPTWEIVTIDSMQVYRGMDIGTAKPTAAEQREVVHHLVDIADPGDDHDVASHQRAARAAVAVIEDRGHRALLVGGTGLYVRAVVDDLDIPGQFPTVRARLEEEPDTAALHRRLTELDPVAAARMEPTNRRRVLRALEVTVGSGKPFSAFGPGLTEHPETAFVLIGIRRTRDDLDVRIAARYRDQLAAGFVAEVEALVGRDRPMSRTAAQALGYRELAEHVRGACTLEAAVELAVTRTRQFARRQEKWFRRDPRIAWVDAEPDTPVEELAEQVRDLIDRRSE